jgi:hypothetical protein
MFEMLSILKTQSMLQPMRARNPRTSEGPLVSGLSNEYATGVAYEQLEEDAAHWADADVSDDEIADARLNPTVEKLAKAFTNHYPEIRPRKFWATTFLDNG